MAPCSWLVLLALAAPNPDVERAIDLMDELKYPEAARALDAARTRSGNDRATVLQILELQAVVASTLGQTARARDFFRALVSIAPDHQLGRDHAPRVRTPFFEAKSWISRRGALQLQADQPPPLGPISTVGARVVADPVKLAREIRFHLRADGGPWRTELVPLAGGRAAIPVTAHHLEWWAELLGEARSVLAQQGSEGQPVVWEAPGPVAPQPPPPPEPLAARPAPPGPGAPGAARAPPAEVPAAALEASPVAAPVGWGLIALGGLSAGVAGYFGWRSSDARARIAGAEVGADGITRGLTQREAFALDARARQDAVVANVLFGLGAAAGAGGFVVLVFGRPVGVNVGPGSVHLESPIP